MTTFDRAAARRRIAAATPGPWKRGIGSECREVSTDDGLLVASCRNPADGTFAAYARTDLPAALDALDIADKEITHLRAIIDAAERLDAGERVEFPQPHPRILSIVAGNRATLKRFASEIEELKAEVKRLRAALRDLERERGERAP